MRFPRSFLLPPSFALVILLSLSCREQPTPPSQIPVSLAIEGSVPVIFSGGSLQLVAVAQYGDGTSRDVSADAAWSNSPARAGLVQAGGNFVAAGDSVGFETVTVAYQGQKASRQIEVTKRAVFLSVTPALVRLASGTVLQFEASAEYHDLSRSFVTDKVRWSISPGLAASIDNNGMVHALSGSGGQETVIAEFQLLRAQSKIEIQAVPQPRFEMVAIPAGSFIMGDDSSAFSDQRPAHEVLVSAFEIGTYEVTNAQYVAFLNEALRGNQILYESGIVTGRGGLFAFLPYTKLCLTDEFSDRFIEYAQLEANEYEFRVLPGFEQYPVVRLSWYGAAAFCAFYGYRLPTEAEWEKAARGGMQLANGTATGAINHDLANYGGTGGADIYSGLAPVGQFPPNPFGLYDLSGNAAEYVFDIYDSNYYRVSPRNDPFGPGPAKPLGRLPGGGLCVISVWRGGSWIEAARHCSATYRGAFCDLPDQCFLSNAVAGFRVARSAP